MLTHFNQQGVGKSNDIIVGINVTVLVDVKPFAVIAFGQIA